MVGVWPFNGGGAGRFVATAWRDGSDRQRLAKGSGLHPLRNHDAAKKGGATADATSVTACCGDGARAAAGRVVARQSGGGGH